MDFDRTALEQRLQRLLAYHRIEPGNPLLARDCAELYCRLGEPAAARALMAPLREQLPEDAPLQFQAATIELALHNPAGAVALLRPLPARGVDNGAVRYNLAFALGLQGEYAAALATLEARWDLVRAEAPRAGLLRARLLHHTGQLAAAIAELEQLLETAPDDIEALGDLALLWVDADDYDAAEAVARRAFAAGGDPYGAQVALGMAALARGETDVARARFLAARERPQEAGRCWLGLGLCELAAGDAEAAAQTLAVAVDKLPAHRPTRQALAWAQIGLRRLDEARATLAEALRLDPAAGDIHALLAIAHIAGGDAEAARASLAQAETLAGGNAHHALYAQGLLLIAAGDAAAAADLLQHAFGAPGNRRGNALLARLSADDRSAM